MVFLFSFPLSIWYLNLPFNENCEVKTNNMIYRKNLRIDAFYFAMLFFFLSCQTDEKQEQFDRSFESIEMDFKNVLVNALVDKIELSLAYIDFASIFVSAGKIDIGYAKISFDIRKIPRDGSYKQSFFDEDVEILENEWKKFSPRSKRYSIDRSTYSFKQIERVKQSLVEVIDAAIDTDGTITIAVKITENEVEINW